MTAIASTSGRIHSEFVRLLFLQAHRETDRFFAASGVHLPQYDSGQFHFHHVTFDQQIKSRVVYIVLVLTNRLSPPRTLILDFNMTHTRYGRSIQHTNGHVSSLTQEGQIVFLNLIDQRKIPLNHFLPIFFLKNSAKNPIAPFFYVENGAMGSDFSLIINRTPHGSGLCVHRSILFTPGHDDQLTNMQIT
jgi:hypothetical protein